MTARPDNFSPFATVRLDDGWEQIRNRLRDPSVTNLLGVAGDASRANRVYLPNDEYEQPPEKKFWWRISVVPTNNPFQGSTTERATIDLRFLTLVEGAPLLVQGFKPHVTAAAIQLAIYRRLRGWAPDLAHARVVSPVVQDRRPQDYPLTDSVNRLWYTSAEYFYLVAAQSAVGTP